MVSESFFRFETFDPERAVTSFLYGPKILLATRVIGSIYTIAVLVGALMTTESLVYFMKYFTHITYIALSIYYVVRRLCGVFFCMGFGGSLEPDTDGSVVILLEDAREKK
jgi:hypothetical protein